MTVKQISVFLENKPGKLSEFTEELYKGGINLRALSLAEASDFGIVRLLVDDNYKAATVIREAGYVYAMNDVLAVSMEDTPGALANAIRALGENGINLEYMYAFTSRQPGKANMVLRVEDNKKAVDVLKSVGIMPITQATLENR